MSKFASYCVALLLAACAATTVSAQMVPAFDVKFSNCVESIGVDILPTAVVRQLVPGAFALAGENDPVTPIVVRTACCGEIAVDGRRGRAGVVVQIGAVIVPPDFSGDINIYAIWYYTSDETLARYLQCLGVPAQHAPNIEYDFGALPAAKPSPFAVDVRRPARPRFSLTGSVTRSTTASGSFEAIWWMTGCDGFVRMDTSVPEIFTGGADLTLKTHPRSQLGKLIGGGSLEFPVLQQFNTFRRAAMAVSIVAP